MNTAFLFLDESVSEHLDTASLTGVLVPADRYVAARDRVLRLSLDVQRPPPNHVPRPIEFHGCEMLSGVDGATNDDKLNAFAALVDIVNRERLLVVSVGYTNWSEIGPLRKHDDKLQGLNFFGVLNLVSEHARDALIVPVVDGLPGGIVDAKRRKEIPPVEPDAMRAFITAMNTNQHARVAVGDHLLSIPNYRNFAEAVFTDSEHSPLLQLADVVGHLLHLQDWRDRFGASGFKASVAAIADRIDQSLVTKWRGRMSFGGT